MATLQSLQSFSISHQHQAFMEHAKDMDLRDLLDEAAFILKSYESEAGTKQSFSYEVSQQMFDKRFSTTLIHHWNFVIQY